MTRTVAACATVLLLATAAGHPSVRSDELSSQGKEKKCTVFEKHRHCSARWDNRAKRCKCIVR